MLSGKTDCAICGKEITESDFSIDGATVCDFTPDSEFGPEVSEFTHTLCRQMESVREKTGVYPECGKGWAPLLLSLIEAIEKLEVPYIVGQVKEKFGGLRFYWHIPMNAELGKPLVDDPSRYARLQRLIDNAEQESFGICEVCGRPGSVREEGWISTRCEDHARKTR